MNKITLSFALLLILPVMSAGETYYMPDDCANFLDCFSLIKGGDKLILRDGTYYGQIKDIPSGTPGQYTEINAEHDGKAVIDGSNISGQYDYPVDIRDRQYIHIEGLAIRNKSNSELMVIRDSHHIKILRTSAINKQNYEGSIIRITGDAHHVLLEDVWVAGSGRYGIIVFKPTATPDEAPHQIILRRCVVRHDYRRRDENPTGTQVYPVAGIQIYGAQPSDHSTLVTRDILLQNCLAIDFNYGDEYYQLSGGLATTARVDRIGFYGNIVLNIKGDGACLPDPWGCSYGSTVAGFPFGGNRLENGGDFIYKDNVAWDITRSGFAFTGGTDTSKTALLNQNTVGQIKTDAAVVNSYSRLQTTVKNSLFYETNTPSPKYGSGEGGLYQEDYNWYYPKSLIPSGATNYISSKPSLEYITITPDAGTGDNGEKRGATILKRYGVSETLWGEPGYDVLTSEGLWPWPYEDEIKDVFSEENTPFVNSYPPTNDVKRGFCTEGSGLYGGPITLTSYIWEYLGNACPDYICNSSSCVHEADKAPCDGCIDNNELFDYIDRWKTGDDVLIADLIDAIRLWKEGC